MATNPGLTAALEALASKKFDAAKHARGTGGKFSSMGGGAKKPGGAVAMAHGIFDKLKGKSKAEMLAAAKAAGLNDNTAKTQLYHWQKKQAVVALGNNTNPTKEELQAAAAKALGVKQAAAAPTPKPVPPISSAKPSHEQIAAKYHAIADGPGTAQEKQDKLTKKLFDDMDSVGPTESVKHMQDAYEAASAKIKKQSDAEVLAKAAKEPAATKPHLKGYSHIVNGEGTKAEKLAKLNVAAGNDLHEAESSAEAQKIKDLHHAAKSKIQAQVETKPPVAEKPATQSSSWANATPTPTMVQNYHTLKDKENPSPAESHYVKAFAEKYPHIAAGPPDLAKLGPTKYVHALADHMGPDADKKAVIAAAVAAGVNKSTAGVQYGKWAANKAGTPPQLQKSPEPAALQAKQSQDMSDKELDKALDGYQGKLSTPNPTANYAPTPYKHSQEYNDYQGGKALTQKLGNNEVYTNKQQGKTFFKSATGNIYEHTGSDVGKMTLVHSVTSVTPGVEAHYDPHTKIVYSKKDGVLKPIAGLKTPIFKNDQPYDPGDHVFKDDAWSAGTNGIQDPNFSGYGSAQMSSLKAVHKAAGVTYNETSSAVQSYTGSGYHAINGELRKSKGTVVGAKAQQIDKLISESSFKEDTIMWRGVGSGEPIWNGSPPPPSLIDHGFTSVSFKPSVAKGFSNGKTLFRVKVPKGFPGLNVAIGSPGSGEAGLHGEAEVMLPRGTTYKAVARHAKAAGNWDVVDLEPQLPQWWIDKHGAPKLG